MSTLFLIGNGFDVNCGMKTRYRDVYEKYVKEDSGTEVVKKFKKDISADFETWGDFEMAMAQYAEKLKGEEEFLECIRDFARYMEQHLLRENNRVKELLNDERILKAVVKEMMQSFSDFYKNISHNIDVAMVNRQAAYPLRFNAISFNYTDVFDILWKEVLNGYKNNALVTHIHGLLQDGPVFGVDNINQIKGNYALTRKGKRGFIKPIFNNEFDQHRVVEAMQKIKNASTICAFGMSFGDSDLSWRNEIIEWLKGDRQHHLFIYRYSFSKVKYYTIPEKMDIEEDAKVQLLMEWGIEGDELFDQIHIPCGKNIFNVETVLKEELVKRDVNKKAELKKKLEQGEKFIQQHAEDIVLT